MSLHTSAQINRHLRTVLGLPNQEEEQSFPNTSEEFQNEDLPDTDFEHDMDIDGGADGDTDHREKRLASSDEGDDGIDTDLPHPVYKKGSDIYSDNQFITHVRAISERRRTRYSLSDHLFEMKIRPKGNDIPFVKDLQNSLEQGLIKFLENLKRVYNLPGTHNQIYVTILEDHIINGLNSGNYSLTTPSRDIAQWVLGMLYNFLKSNQSLKLDESFRIHIKLISSRHANDLHRKKGTPFRRHIYH